MGLPTPGSCTQVCRAPRNSGCQQLHQRNIGAWCALSLVVLQVSQLGAHLREGGLQDRCASEGGPCGRVRTPVGSPTCAAAVTSVIRWRPLTSACPTLLRVALGKVGVRGLLKRACWRERRRWVSGGHSSSSRAAGCSPWTAVPACAALLGRHRKRGDSAGRQNSGVPAICAACRRSWVRRLNLMHSPVMADAAACCRRACAPVWGVGIGRRRSGTPVWIDDALLWRSVHARAPGSALQPAHADWARALWVQGAPRLLPRCIVRSIAAASTIHPSSHKQALLQQGGAAAQRFGAAGGA